MACEKQAGFTTPECKQSLDGILRITQYIDGNWVTLIDLKLAKPAETFEKISDSVSNMTKFIADAASVYLTSEDGESIILMKSQGPIKVKFISK